jgi:UDP-galactopyranose mutase
VPTRYNYDDRYFTDRFQGVPEQGYTAMVEQMLTGIPCQIATDYLLDPDYWHRQARRVIYSGPIDALFDYDLGRLEYRSLEFRHQVLDVPDYQGTSTINYTALDIPHTRVLEWQHYGWRPNKTGRTAITIEYPRARGEPYYPVGDAENHALYSKYASRAAELSWLYVGGRLGSYRYYNMDQVIGQAMKLVTEL